MYHVKKKLSSRFQSSPSLNNKALCTKAQGDRTLASYHLLLIDSECWIIEILRLTLIAHKFRTLDY